MSFAQVLSLALIFAGSTRGEESAKRIAADRAAGRPLVAHVLVALADNSSQGIVPVPKHLGDGRDPSSNLYWGAKYGVRSFLSKSAGWKIERFAGAHPEHVLERMVFSKVLDSETTVYLVADAWDGNHMRGALQTFSHFAAGHGEDAVRVLSGDRTVELAAGGGAHVVAYLGHNGLMELTIPDSPEELSNSPPRSAIILACISNSYFPAVLKKSGAHLLLSTRGLMAPEAYTLDAALAAWFTGRSASEVKREAGAAYCRYQKCSTRAGERLFATE